MTDEELVEMVKKSGWSGIYTQWAEPTGEADWSPYKVSLTVPVTIEQIEAFAKLVAEKEREACAKIAENRMLHDKNENIKKGYLFAQQSIAQDIRTRGQE